MTATPALTEIIEHPMRKFLDERFDEFLSGDLDRNKATESAEQFKRSLNRITHDKMELMLVFGTEQLQDGIRAVVEGAHEAVGDSQGLLPSSAMSKLVKILEMSSDDVSDAQLTWLGKLDTSVVIEMIEANRPEDAMRLLESLDEKMKTRKKRARRKEVRHD